MNNTQCSMTTFTNVFNKTKKKKKKQNYKRNVVEKNNFNAN